MTRTSACWDKTPEVRASQHFQLLYSLPRSSHHSPPPSHLTLTILWAPPLLHTPPKGCPDRPTSQRKSSLAQEGGLPPTDWPWHLQTSPEGEGEGGNTVRIARRQEEEAHASSEAVRVTTSMLLASSCCASGFALLDKEAGETAPARCLKQHCTATAVASSMNLSATPIRWSRP